MKAVLQFWIISVGLTNVICSEQSNKALPQETSSCESHDQCPDSKACINETCADPCESLCGQNTHCTTLQHIPACACKEGHTGNPFIRCNLQVTEGKPTIPHGRKRFQIVDTFKVEWLEAFTFCIRNNTRLATLDNMAEFEEVRTLIKKTGRVHEEYLLSALDIGFEGNFIWVPSGKPLPLTSKMWRRNEPNNIGFGVGIEEDCLSLGLFGGDDDTGNGCNDYPCHRPTYFICEYYD